MMTGSEYIKCLKTMLPQPVLVAEQFVLWRSVPDKDSTKKPKKLPFYANGVMRNGTLDAPEDVSNLVGFDVAACAYEAGQYTGIGFAVVRAGGVGGLDIDYCIGDDGSLSPEAQSIVDAAKKSGCYIERSPSKKGLRILGHTNGFAVIKSAGFEAYSEKRYLTVTGDVIENSQGWGDITPAYNVMQSIVSHVVMATRPSQVGSSRFEVSNDLSNLVPLIKDGERNHRLFSIACGVRNSGGDYDGILSEIRSVNADPERMADGSLDDSELEQIAKSAMRYPADPIAAETVTGGSPQNDTGNAERLIKFAAGQGIAIRYVVERKDWLIWGQVQNLL